MLMNQELERSIVEATSAQSLGQVEVVQELWGGYGKLQRVAVVGGQVDSVIVKEVQPSQEREHPRGWGTDVGKTRKLRSYQVESQWYENYAMRCSAGCRVPACLFVRSYDGNVCIVMEDLDVSGFARRCQKVGERESKACLAWLAQFHATFLGVEPEGLWQIGTYWNLGTRPEEWQALPEGVLKQAAGAIDDLLNDCRFQTLVHGDAKLENFCFSMDGAKAAAVDFQYVGQGCGMKDVAYWMSSCFDERECQAREEELLSWYFSYLESALHARGGGADFSALEEEWRRLYPVAWTDFYRFLKGWSPQHWKLHSYSEETARRVIEALG